MKKETAIYLAGLIDGDGSFTISMTIKNPSILFTPHVRIALKENDAEHLMTLRNEINIGKIYFSNKGKPHGICSWQTTNTIDLIKICEYVIPYLRIKRRKGESILKTAKIWLQTMPPPGQNRRGGNRTKKQITEMVKASLNLNPDRQTVRYREKKGWDYWSKTINRLYS